MDNMTRNAVRTLIGAREEISFQRLNDDLDYQEVCRQQEKSEEVVEELYQQFEKPDRLTIRRHYEGEVYKTSFQLKEAYIQGLRDCFSLVHFLSGNEVRL